MLPGQEMYNRMRKWNSCDALKEIFVEEIFAEFNFVDFGAIHEIKNWLVNNTLKIYRNPL